MIQTICARKHGAETVRTLHGGRADAEISTSALWKPPILSGLNSTGERSTLLASADCKTIYFTRAPFDTPARQPRVSAHNRTTKNPVLSVRNLQPESNARRKPRASTDGYPSGSLCAMNYFLECRLAEGAGFEPAVHEWTPVFKTGGFNRSPTPPRSFQILRS